MNEYEVRELHEWHRPYRWAVHKDRMIVARYTTDVEAYAHMNDLIARPGLYCDICCTRLMVKTVCTIFCPNKKCGDKV